MVCLASANSLERACQLGHPASQNHAVPKDLQLAIKKHVEWSEQTLVEYTECTGASVELEPAETADAVIGALHMLGPPL